jgi:hypothetical protein
MGVVHKPIQDGVGDSRIWDHLVPMLDRQLGRHNRRATSMPVVDDFQQFARLIERDRGEAPVVEDQEIDAR